MGKSGSIVRAPGVVERRLMSRRASTSRWMSYSDGCRVRVAIVELRQIAIISVYAAALVTDCQESTNVGASWRAS